MDRDGVRRWVTRYEDAWRSAGTDMLDEIFTADATYLVSPWAELVFGLDPIRQLWEAERHGHDEQFTMTSDVVAVEGNVAVVRAEIVYADDGRAFRDLWVLLFDDDGRCRAFEEWPFAPDQPDGR